MPDLPGPDPYDQLPYSDYAWQPSHPDQLAAIAWIRGSEPPPVDTARVLEIGCANGGNLLPMAAGLPRGQFVGIDRSAVQIATGQALKNKLGIDNLILLQVDLEDAEGLATSAELDQPFDYILAHGLWGWVSAPARAAVLRMMGTLLSPTGVAYISTDMLPGSRLRQMARDLLHFHDKPERGPGPRVEQARAVLKSIAAATPPHSMHGVLLRKESRRAHEPDSSFLFHDRLSEHYNPVLLTELVRQGAEHGLRYLGDAKPNDMVPSSLPDDLKAALDDGDAPLETRLQYEDFIVRRVFRRVLLTPKGAPLSWPPDEARLAAMYVRGNVEVEKVTGDNVTGIEQRSIEALAAAYPAAVRVDDLADDDDETRSRVREVMLQTWLADSVQLRLRPSPAATTPGTHPRAPIVARHQAAQGRNLVVNALHALIKVDPIHRAMLPAMDGTHDRLALLTATVQKAVSGDLKVHRDDLLVDDPIALAEILAPLVSKALNEMVRTGLILTEDGATS